MLYYERKFKKQGCDIIIGVDEVGVGPLAGPVVACAVALRTTRFTNRVDDSKKLSCSQREKAFFEIIGKSMYGLGIVNEKVIDRINIFEAARIAMEEAITALAERLRLTGSRGIHILIDGRVKPRVEFPCSNIIKGDAKSKSIASASIVAKVTRDRIMGIYDAIYPQYGFRRHKGYPTSAHRSAIKEFGPCVIHRKSFCGV